MDALETLHGEYRSRGRAMQSFRIIAELCERVRIDLIALGDLYVRNEDAGAVGCIGNVLAGADTILGHLSEPMPAAQRSEESRVGKERVRKCSSRVSTDQYKTNYTL